MQSRREDDIPPGPFRGLTRLLYELGYAFRMVFSFLFFSYHARKVILMVAFYCYMRDIGALKRHNAVELNAALELAVYEESFTFSMEFYRSILKKRVVWKHLIATGAMNRKKGVNDQAIRSFCVDLSADIPMWLTYASRFEMANDLTNVYFKIKNFEEFGNSVPYLL